MTQLTLRMAATIALVTMLLVLVATLASAAHGTTTPDARPKPAADVTLSPIPRDHAHGHWVMGADTHAYWCWGPTIRLGSWDGDVKTYATVCEGPHSMVVLHD